MTYQEEIDVVAKSILLARDFNLNEKNEAEFAAIERLGYLKNNYKTSDLIESAFIEADFIEAGPLPD